MTPKPVSYQGRMVYPLKDVDPFSPGSDARSCRRCIFDHINCAAFGSDMQKNSLGMNCIGVHWAEGEAAQLQYVKERLTS